MSPIYKLVCITLAVVLLLETCDAGFAGVLKSATKGKRGQWPGDRFGDAKKGQWPGDRFGDAKEGSWPGDRFGDAKLEQKRNLGPFIKDRRSHVSEICTLARRAGCTMGI